MKRTEVTIEHMIPGSLGGSNKQANLKLACWSCNNKRGNKYDPHAFTYY